MAVLRILRTISRASRARRLPPRDAELVGEFRETVVNRRWSYPHPGGDPGRCGVVLVELTPVGYHDADEIGRGIVACARGPNDGLMWQGSWGRFSATDR